MLIFFPSGTDAPCYHPPFATFGLIGVNILIFALQCAFPDFSDWFILRHGTFNPIAWVSSICMHGNFQHLLGNMVAFVVFGFIVEGKVGWWRTLAMFFAIGIITNLMELLLFSLLGSSGGSLGASSAIFGFIAVALLWAPENNINFTYFGLLFFWPVFGTVEISVAVYCYFMIAVEFLAVWFFGVQAGSAFLHLLGVLPGVAVGYWMIKARQVDCEGYDLVSIWQGREGESTPTLAAEKAQKEREQFQRDQAQKEIRTGLAKVNEYIQSGQHEMAIKRFQMLRNKDRRMVMTERQLLTIIKAFDQDEQKREKILPLIETYLANYQTHQTSLRLMQAKVHLLMQSRPRKALHVLRPLNQQALTPKQRNLFLRLAKRAQEMIANGVLELE